VIAFTRHDHDSHPPVLFSIGQGDHGGIGMLQQRHTFPGLDM